MRSRAEKALVIVRVAVAATLIIHGVARIGLGIVDDFGGFWAEMGVPFGVPIAWAITFVEIVGGTLLATGYFVVPLAAYFILQLAAGIALIHSRAGWFVVGAGRNGMEFSVLLIVVFAALIFAHWKQTSATNGVE